MPRHEIQIQRIVISRSGKKLRHLLPVVRDQGKRRQEGKKLLIKTKRDQAIITPLPDDPVEYFYRGLHQNRPNFPVLEPFADRFVPTRVCRPLFFTADSSHLMFLASFL